MDERRGAGIQGFRRLPGMGKGDDAQPHRGRNYFRADWIRYKKLPRLSKYEMLVCYTDPSFKSTTSNDYKACRLWGKIGKELHLIDCYVRQDTVSGMVRWLYDLYERTRDTAAVQFFMEANFMQDVILDEFEAEGNLRGYQLPIMPDKRKKPDKLQRIEAVSPLWERGFVFYNEKLKESPDMQTGIEQTLALERGSRIHDDAPDADEGAIWMLQRNSRQESFQPVFGKRSTAKIYGNMIQLIKRMILHGAINVPLPVLASTPSSTEESTTSCIWVAN